MWPRVVAALAVAGAAVLFWRELPALRRYLKTERM
ncbi:DUF6893 family small protein [Segeticoccus sp.]